MTATPSRKFKKVAVGGTFDVVHRGHEVLLARAFEIGGTVLIGVVGDSLAKELPKNHPIAAFSHRVQNLETFLKQRGWSRRSILTRLDDKFGATVFDPSIEALIVTPETAETAHEINKIRRGNGLAPIHIEIVQFVLADDGRPISTTRIRDGKINSQGRVLRVRERPR
jgi:pantetheine-phosphate adenylyltransferase